MKYILIILSLFNITSSFALDRNELTPLDKQWYINPFGKENPVFYGGPELFASSRMGQVYLPGAGVALLRPVYMFSSQMMGSKLATNLSGVATDYIAHVAWRLGCDQGYLAAKELKFQSYPSVSEFLLGESSDYRLGKIEGVSVGVDTTSHPTLGDKLNQTITPTAILMFGAGQVLGQRFFGPFVTRQLSKMRFFGKRMSPATAGATMDMYGWPVPGGGFSRADSVGKISGILLGTYLGWSFNDFGWQMANWRKISDDPFSEYMPYHGNENFGSIDKGWGILGFTIGGFLGHNIGFSLSHHGLTKLGLATSTNIEKYQGSRQYSNWQRRGVTFLNHGSAITGNLLLGLTLTTYFPYLYKTAFNKFENHKPSFTIKPFTSMTPAEQDAYLDKFLTASIDESFMYLVDAHQSVLKKTYKEVSMDLVESEIVLELEDSDYEVPQKQDNKLLEFSQELATQRANLKSIVSSMAGEIQQTVTELNEKLKDFQYLEDFKALMFEELMSLFPDEFYLDKKAAIQEVISRIDDPRQLDKYKKRFIELVVTIYPYVYKHAMAQQMQELTKQLSPADDALVSYLVHKRDVVTLQLAKAFERGDKEAETLRLEFESIHANLIGHDYEFYEKRPELLKNYEKALDEFSEKLSSRLGR